MKCALQLSLVCLLASTTTPVVAQSTNELPVGTQVGRPGGDQFQSEDCEITYFYQLNLRVKDIDAVCVDRLPEMRSILAQYVDFPWIAFGADSALMGEDFECDATFPLVPCNNVRKLGGDDAEKKRLEAEKKRLGEEAKALKKAAEEAKKKQEEEKKKLEEEQKEKEKEEQKKLEEEKKKEEEEEKEKQKEEEEKRKKEEEKEKEKQEEEKRKEEEKQKEKEEKEKEEEEKKKEEEEKEKQKEEEKKKKEEEETEKDKDKGGDKKKFDDEDFADFFQQQEENKATEAITSTESVLMEMKGVGSCPVIRATECAREKLGLIPKDDWHTDEAIIEVDRKLALQEYTYQQKMQQLDVRTKKTKKGFEAAMEAFNQKSNGERGRLRAQEAQLRARQQQQKEQAAAAMDPMELVTLANTHGQEWIALNQEETQIEQALRQEEEKLNRNKVVDQDMLNNHEQLLKDWHKQEKLALEKERDSVIAMYEAAHLLRKSRGKKVQKRAQELQETLEDYLVAKFGEGCFLSGQPRVDMKVDLAESEEEATAYAGDCYE